MNKRRSIWLSALLAATCLSGAAAAQGVPDAPPQRYQFDANGVDRVTGNARITSTDLTIGPAGPGGLAYVRYYQTGGSADGWDGSLSNWTFVLYTVPGEPNRYKVGVGATTDEFYYDGASFDPVAGGGSSLTRTGNVYTYTTASGDVVTFDLALPSSFEPTVLSRASKIAYATGEEATLTWRSTSYCSDDPIPDPECQGGVYLTRVRLQAVDSSQGYQLRFRYALNGIPTEANAPEWNRFTGASAVNTTLDYCDPGATNCATPNQTPASVSYASTWAGSTQTINATDPVGDTTRFTVSASRIAVKRPTSGTDNIVYTITNNRVSQVVRDGLTWGYAYTAAGSGLNATLTTTVTDPAGNTSSTVANVRLSVIKSATDELGKTTSYIYDTSGRLLSVTRPEGNKVTYAYDARGNATEIRAISKTPGTPPDLVTGASYPATCADPVSCNQPATTTDARGRVTNYTYYPSNGLIASVTSPAPAAGATRPQTRYGYASLQAYVKNAGGAIVASGVPVYRLVSVSQCITGAGASPTGTPPQPPPACEGTADEARATVAYGTAGQANNLLATAMTRKAGDGSLTATTATAFDAAGDAITVDGPLAGADDTTRVRFDANRRVVGVTSPDPDGTGGGASLKPRATRVSYNADGQATLIEQGTVVNQTDPAWANFVSLQQLASSYDANARRIKDTATAGGATYSVTQYNYDVMGRAECSALRMNPAEWGSLPGSACTPDTAGTYGPDRITKQTYDAASRPLVLTTALATADERAETTLGYDDNGAILSVIDGDGNRTGYAYDGFGRLTKTNYPRPNAGGKGQSNPDDYEELTYTGVDVTARRVRDGQTITYAYDFLGRLKSKVRPDPPGTNRNLSYTYDNLGRVLTASGSLPTVATYSWDALGRLTGETDAAAGGTIGYLYDAAGRMTRQTWETGNIWAGYTRLVTGEVEQVNRNGGSLLATYAYDDLGRRKTLTRNNDVVTTYGYDTGSRLTSLAHNFPGSANDVTTTFAYNPAGQIVSRASSNDLYAAAPPANGATPYTINGLNQVTKIGVGAGAPTVTHDERGNITAIGASAYSYGADNLMQSAPGGTFVYDALDRLWRIDAEDRLLRYGASGAITSEHDQTTGAVTKRYIHGAGIDEPLVAFTGAGVSSKRWLIADERGSIIAETDNDGAVTQINRYDEYGVPGAANAGRFQYTGQAWVPSMGMYYYKARVYNPDLGRFMQTDPIGYASGMNLYAYVAGDPVNFIDPWGLQEQETVCPPGDEDAPEGCTIRVTGKKVRQACGVGQTMINGECQGLPGAPSYTSAGVSDVVVTGRRPQRASLLRRIYRWFVPDPCQGKGTDEGAGTPTTVDPYDVNEGASLAALLGHVLPDHDFSGSFSDSRFLTGVILTTILTNPVKASGGSIRYTVNTGQNVGWDSKHRSSSDYITVIMGPAVDGSRALQTAYPGCP